jgi:ssDNA-binding Zn-finger/Zn-ribbon topoisomerase 1
MTTKTGEYKYHLFTGDSRCVRAGELEILGDFKQPERPPSLDDALKTDKDINDFIEDENPDVATIGEDEDKWPINIPCHDCNALVPRRESKFDGAPYYYKCPNCKKNSWPKWYLEEKYPKKK